MTKGFLDAFNIVPILALAFGSFSQALGLDVAPKEIDILVTATMTVGAILIRWYTQRKA